MNLEQNTPSIRATAMVNLLVGFWLFISPWVYGFYKAPVAWNSWIVGMLIAGFAAIRLSKPLTMRGLSVFNLFLGAWTFASPWIYGYTGSTNRFLNSLCVGAIVFILAAYGSFAGMGHTTTPPAVRT
jgi:hypothetical protein